MDSNRDENSKAAISFVAIRIIMGVISAFVSFLVAKGIYNFAKDINGFLAILCCIIIVLFIMIAVNKTITELILKIIKKQQ